MFLNQSVHGVSCLVCFRMFKMSYTCFLYFNALFNNQANLIPA